MRTTERTDVSRPLEGLEHKLAKISPWTKRIGADTDDPEHNAFAMAEDMRVNQMHQRLLRPVLPERPALIPATDEEVVGLLQKGERDNVSPIDRKLITVICRWRNAVEAAEYEAAERLRALLWTITLYQRCDQGRPEVRAGIEGVAAFVRRNYGVEAVPIPKEYGRNGVDHRLVNLTTQWDVCSFAVRRGRFPKGRDDVAEAADPGADSMEFDDVFGGP